MTNKALDRWAGYLVPKLREHAANPMLRPIAEELEAAAQALTAAIKQARDATDTMEKMRPIWADPNHSDMIGRVALVDLWLALGVTNQTAAIQRVLEWRRDRGHTT